MYRPSIRRGREVQGIWQRNPSALVFDIDSFCAKLYEAGLHPAPCAPAAFDDSKSETEAPENAEDDVTTLSPPKNIMKMRIASPPKALSPPLQDEGECAVRANWRESPDCGEKTSAALKAKQRRKLYTRPP